MEFLKIRPFLTGPKSKLFFYLVVDPFKRWHRGRIFAPCFNGHGSIRFETTNFFKMVQITGKYAFVSQDKFDDYLKAAGEIKNLFYSARFGGTVGKMVAS